MAIAAYWQRIKDYGNKQTSSSADIDVKKKSSIKIPKIITPIDDVYSRRFTQAYITPFMKLYAIQNDAKHVRRMKVVLDLMNYIEKKHGKDVLSSKMLKKMYTAQFGRKLATSYREECGRLFMYNMYNVVPKNDPERVRSCTSMTRTKNKQPCNEIVGMSASEYARHCDYVLRKRQIDIFRKKCVQEGTLFQWNIRHDINKQHNRYYVEKKQCKKYRVK